MSGKQLRSLKDCAWVYSQPKFKENLREGRVNKSWLRYKWPQPFLHGWPPIPPGKILIVSVASLPLPLIHQAKMEMPAPQTSKEEKTQLGDPSFLNIQTIYIIIFLQPKHKSMHPSTHATKHLATVGGSDVAAAVSAAATASVGMDGATTGDGDGVSTQLGSAGMEDFW